MIAIASDFGAKIRLVPIVPEEVVIICYFSDFPTVERLVHHEDAHTVTEIEKFGSRRIVTRAEGVNSHFLENLQLAFRSAGIECRSQCSEVVVVANTVELNALSIEEKPAVCFELDRSDAESSLVGVDDLTFG